MGSRQVLPCLPKVPLKDFECSGEHSPLQRSNQQRSNPPIRTVARIVQLAEGSPLSNSDLAQPNSTGFRDTRLPHLPRPFTSRSLPNAALSLSEPDSTPAPVDSKTAHLPRCIPSEICELRSKPRIFSTAGHIAGRDTMAAAGSRLRGERGFLAMEEEPFESLGQPTTPASLHATQDDRSPVTHAPGARLNPSAQPEVFDPSHKTAGGGSLENLDDLQLVSAAQSGEAAAFDILMLRHTSKLYGLVYHMSSSHEDTDDLLQEIWAKVYRSLPSFRGASRFSTWVHSIAVNMTLNFLKKRNRRSPVSINAAPEGSDATLADLPGIDAELEDALICNQTPRTDANRGELQKLLSDALDELTPEHRAVVTMFDVQGMAHAEIAKVMGISEGTVRSRLFYAHRQLQSYLSGVASDFLQTPNKNAL